MYSIVPPLFLRLFFLSLIPPPPRSTLFPYTTLFRSTSEPGETICRRCPGAHLACVLLDREAVVRSHTPLEHSEKRGPELTTWPLVFSSALSGCQTGTRVLPPLGRTIQEL